MADLMQTVLMALRRGGASEGQQVLLEANEKNQLLTAMGLPPYLEVVRRYGMISAMNTAAAAALIVRPSTVSNFTLYNNESAGGKMIVPDRLFAFNLVSTAAQARSGMWYCVHPTGMTAPTNDITVRKSSRGDSAVVTKSIFDNGATVVDDGWFPCGNWADVEPTGVLPGAIMEHKFEGRVIIPPTAALSAQVVSSVVGNTFTMGLSWFEIPLLTVGAT